MQTSLSHVVAQRNLSAVCAGAVLTTARDLAETFSMDDPDLPVEVRRLVDGPLSELREVVRVPAGSVGVLIDGVPVPDPAEATPASWQDAAHSARASRILLLLSAAALGTPFGWLGQQQGRLVTDLVPTRGHETAQTGASCAIELTLHTEDAFHPERATHFMLFGLRNPGGTGTMLAPAREALTRLSRQDRTLLQTPGAPILPDSSYALATDAGPARPMTAVWERPEGYGLRFDPAYTELEQASAPWRAAYARLDAALRAETLEVPVLPGQILVVDNDACVHGRVPFTPRYDGTDRWLLRVNISRAHAGRPAREADEHGYGQHHHTPFTDEVPV